MATADDDRGIDEDLDFQDVEVAGIDQEVAGQVFTRLEQAREDAEFRHGKTFFFPTANIDQEGAGMDLGDDEDGSIEELHFGIEVSNVDPLGDDAPSSSLQLLLIKAGDGSFRVLHHYNVAAEQPLAAEGVNALLRSLLQAEEVVSEARYAEDEVSDEGVVDDVVRKTRGDLV